VQKEYLVGGEGWRQVDEGDGRWIR